MLLEDLLGGPAAGPVELGDDAAAVVQLHLVHAVLEGVERVAQAGAAQTGGLHPVEDAVGGQGQEEVGGLVGQGLSSGPRRRPGLAIYAMG